VIAGQKPVCIAWRGATVPKVGNKDQGRSADESFEGEEELLGGPPPSRDPYTPEPGPRAGEQRAFRIMRWAWVPLLIVVFVILIAFFR
jgi:hypothetical protein